MPERTCVIDDCDRPHLARGWCKPHYRRWAKYGDPEATPTRDYFKNVPEGQKRCHRCHEIQPMESFYASTHPYDAGRQSWCKKCVLAYRAKWRRRRTPEKIEERRRYEKRQKARANFGLTFEQYDAMMADPRCHVCGVTDQGRRKRHHIDHDHATGKVRGLLCHECNTALGLADEDPERLRALAAYIEKHREPKWPESAQDQVPA